MLPSHRVLVVVMVEEKGEDHAEGISRVVGRVLPAENS